MFTLITGIITLPFLAIGIFAGIDRIRTNRASK